METAVVATPAVVGTLEGTARLLDVRHADDHWRGHATAARNRDITASARAGRAATITTVNPFDATVVALVVAFGYRGYRSGAIGLVLGLTGGLLAFGLAAAMAPLIAPQIEPLLSDRLGVPSLVVRPTLVVVVSFGLRWLLGYAVRELTAALRLVVRSVPPLAWADRLLGIVPAAALGGLLGVAVVVAAGALPASLGARDAAADSWVARTIIAHPGQTLQSVGALAVRLVREPPRINGVVLGFGTVGLMVAWVGSTRLRADGGRRAPTRSAAARPAPVTEAAPPMIWTRTALGVGVALALAVLLLTVIRVR